MRSVSCTAHMKKIIAHRYLGSRLVLKSSQYVRIKNDNDVNAAYEISSHYSQSTGIAQNKVVSMNDEKL